MFFIRAEVFAMEAFMFIFGCFGRVCLLCWIVLVLLQCFGD